MTLPPGQHAVDRFPRFGTHFASPAPAVPSDPAIEVRGAVQQPLTLPLSSLATLPRKEVAADFHCVAGWTATNLRWEGVTFATFYRAHIEPALSPDDTVTHLAFGGLDGYRSFVMIEDGLAEDVLVAEHLNDQPLDSDHGAPVRLVSPRQYGYISVKHLCRIEVHTAMPAEAYHPSAFTQLGLQLVKPHPRARVWEEERHRYLPGTMVRPIYRLLIPPIAFLSARGSSRGRDVP